MCTMAHWLTGIRRPKTPDQNQLCMFNYLQGAQGIRDLTFNPRDISSQMKQVMQLWSARGSSSQSTMPHGNRMTPIRLGTSCFSQVFTHQGDNQTHDSKLWYPFHILMKARLHISRMQPLLKLSRTLELSTTFLCLKPMAFILRGLRGSRGTFRRTLWNVDLPFPIRYLIPNSPTNTNKLRLGRKTELLLSASSHWPEESRDPRKSRDLSINLAAKTFRTYYCKNW